MASQLRDETLILCLGLVIVTGAQAGNMSLACLGCCTNASENCLDLVTLSGSAQPRQGHLTVAMQSLPSQVYQFVLVMS